MRQSIIIFFFLNFLFFRSTSDVPLKIRDFAVILTDLKSTYKLNAKYWTEVNEISETVNDNDGNIIDSDFMMHPNKFYRLKFATEQCQFSENSELQVRLSY